MNRRDADADLGKLISAMVQKAARCGECVETELPFLVNGKGVTVTIRVYKPQRKDIA